LKKKAKRTKTHLMIFNTHCIFSEKITKPQLRNVTQHSWVSDRSVYYGLMGAILFFCRKKGTNREKVIVDMIK